MGGCANTRWCIVHTAVLPPRDPRARKRAARGRREGDPTVGVEASARPAQHALAASSRTCSSRKNHPWAQR
eukprot:226483-Prymnesium_polylepis.1